MRILQISNYIYPVIGGIERVAEDTAHFLKNTNAEQKIICFNDVPVSDKHKSLRIKNITDYYEGVEVIRCGCIAKIFSQSLSPSIPFKLKRTIKDFKPDAVIFHYPNPFVAFFLLRIKKPFKLILWWHADIVKGRLLTALFEPQNQKLIKRADMIVGATPVHISGSDHAAVFAPDKTRILPYTVGEYRFADIAVKDESVQEIRDRFAGKIICLFVGRHVTYKGLVYLLEASRMLDDRFAFLIAGSGRLTEELKSIASGDEKVHFIGSVSETEKIAYLKACDIFCFPSITRNENFGLAMAEAMYFSKPTVTFSIKGSGVNFLSVDGVTGIESPNKDSKALAQALYKLGTDEDLRKQLGSAARKRITELFSDEAFENNLVALLREIGDIDER